MAPFHLVLKTIVCKILFRKTRLFCSVSFQPAVYVPNQLIGVSLESDVALECRSEKKTYLEWKTEKNNVIKNVHIVKVEKKISLAETFSSMSEYQVLYTKKYDINISEMTIYSYEYSEVSLNHVR